MRVLIFPIAFLFICCNSGEKLIFGANKDKTFSSLSEYKSFMRDKYGINSKQFYQADEKSYNSLLYYIAGNKIDYLLGIFENDSIEYKKSIFLEDNESCVGRITNEIEAISKLGGTEKKRNIFFQQNRFINFEDQKKLDWHNSQTIKVVLVVSYKLGRIHKNDFIKIEEIVRHHTGFELIILSLDKIDSNQE